MNTTDRETPPPARPLRRILREAGFILIAAAVAGAAMSLIGGNGDTGIPSATAPPSVSDTAVSLGPKLIDVTVAEQWFEEDAAVFIDVRDKYDYAANHVPGAVHLDVRDFDLWMMDIYRDLSRDERIIVYGDGDSDGDVHLLAERLTQMGFQNVYYLSNGWHAWLSRGLPHNDVLPDRPGFRR